MKARFRTFLTIVAALWLASAPAVATAAAPAPRPAIWVLADEDTRIFLFGTVHILPPGLRWRSAALDRIVAEADELVLEIADDQAEADPLALFGPMLLGKQVSILSRVSPERREPLRRMIDATGIPIESFDAMHSWAAGLVLTATALAQAYAGDEVEPETLTGVEDALRADFVQAKRPISGVETADQQLAFFSRLSLRSQRAFLESMVDSYLEGEGMFDPTEQGWVSGDVDQIGMEMEELPPDLFDTLITRRNAAWTSWLVERLDRPGTVLFAVGAGHLAGRDSVQSMLADRGFTVTRVD